MVHVDVSLFVAQVPLLRHCGEGELTVLWCDVFQERSRLGERDRQERSEQTDGGIFTPIQTWNVAARVPKCQRFKSTSQSARGEGDRVWSVTGRGGFLSFFYTHRRACAHTRTRACTQLIAEWWVWKYAARNLNQVRILVNNVSVLVNHLWQRYHTNIRC